MKCPCLRIIKILTGAFLTSWNWYYIFNRFGGLKWRWCCRVTMEIVQKVRREGLFCATFLNLDAVACLNTWRRKGAVLYSTSVSARRHCGPRLHPRGWMFWLDVHLVTAACVCVFLNVSKDYIQKSSRTPSPPPVSFIQVSLPCMNKSELEPFVWFPFLFLIYFFIDFASWWLFRVWILFYFFLKGTVIENHFC